MTILLGRAIILLAGPAFARYLLAGSALLAAHSRQTNLQLVELTHPFMADTTIGSRKVGLMCLPKGKVRWGDISTGTSDDLRAIVANRLNTVDVPATSAAVGNGVIRLRARIIGLTVSACAKKFGLGQPGALTGKGVIEMEWTKEPVGPGLARSFVTRANFSFQPMSDNRAPILDAALDETALLVAQELAAPSPR